MSGRPKKSGKRFDSSELTSPIALLALLYMVLASVTALAAWRGLLQCPLPLAIYCGAVFPLSVVTFILYARDKRLAVIHANRTFRQGATRVPEAVLHTWEFLGGWPGALLAQKTLRHKSNKGSFLVITWLTVTLHLLGAFLAVRYSTIKLL